MVKKWFDMVASGTKKEEYRIESQWILSRLEGKSYDFVEFKNGYEAGSPTCLVEFLGWTMGFGRKEWGGGSTQGKPLVVIKLGKVVSL